MRNPGAIRPWQHVLEPLHGYLTLAAKLWKSPEKFATSYNFGPRLNDTFTVEELVQKALKYWPGGKYRIQKQKRQPHEAGLLKLDIGKAAKELGWIPLWDSDASIKHTIDWYRKSTSKKNTPWELVKLDILEYIKS